MSNAAPATPTVDPPALVDLIADGVEQPITLRAAARLPELCVDGKPMSLAKLHRVSTRPVRGVLLDTAPIAGRVCTTRPAVRRWLQALNDARTSRTTPVGQTPRRQAAVAKRAHAAAVAELSRAGFKLTGGYVQ